MIFLKSIYPNIYSKIEAYDFLFGLEKVSVEKTKYNSLNNPNSYKKENTFEISSKSAILSISYSILKLEDKYVIHSCFLMLNEDFYLDISDHPKYRISDSPHSRTQLEIVSKSLKDREEEYIPEDLISKYFDIFLEKFRKKVLK